MVTDEPTSTIPFPIGARFSRLSTAQQMIALREALAWQRQGLDFAAALSLAVRQVERVPRVVQMVRMQINAREERENR